MSKPAGVLTQQQVRSAVTGAFAAGARQVTVKAVTPEGTVLTLIANVEPTTAEKHRGNARSKAEAPSASARQAAI
jgi:hypothetical protein